MIKTILILEDNLLVLSKLLEQLGILEYEISQEFSLIILTTAQQVQDYINSNPKAHFDVIILDRSCKTGGTFHILDFDRFGPEKIISISSARGNNNDALERGVKTAVLKDYNDIEKFTLDVVKEIKLLL